MGSAKSSMKIEHPHLNTTYDYETAGIFWDPRRPTPLQQYAKRQTVSWESMPTFPVERFAKGIGLNQDEFLVVTNSLNNMGGRDGIYSYTMHDNKLSQIVSYSSLGLGNVDNPNAAYNKESNTLYIHCGIYNNHKLIILDLDSLTSNVIEHQHEIGYDAQCIVVDNVFHIIGGWKSNKHYTFDEDTNTWKVVHTFDSLSPGFGAFGLVHLRKRQELLLLGGKQGQSALGTIYSFCLIRQKWTKLQVTLEQPLHSFGVVGFEFDRYLLLFGGVTKFGALSQAICVFDIEAQKFITLQDIEIPFDAAVKAIKTSNYIFCELLITGFLRSVWRYWPGQDMIDLMIAMYGLQEYVHLIEDNKSGAHKRIDVQQLLTADERVVSALTH